MLTGAGARFDPPKYLKPGDVVEIEVEGIGTLRNGVEDRLDASAREQLRARRDVIFGSLEGESSRGWMMYFAVQDVIAEPDLAEVRQ